MAYRVEWSAQAVEDLDAIGHYIARDSTVYASVVVKSILDATRKLSRFPFAGRVVPELDDEHIRERFVYTFRIIYRVRDRVVTVAAIVHGKRMLDME